MSVDFLARLPLAEAEAIEAVALAAAAVASPAPTTAAIPPLAFVGPLASALTSPFIWDALGAAFEGVWLFPPRAPPASPPSTAPPPPAELLERFLLLEGYGRSELSLQAGHNHYTDRSCVVDVGERRNVQTQRREGAKGKRGGINQA